MPEKPSVLWERLNQWADWRERDYGCPHRSAFGEWCAECREQEAKDMIEASRQLQAAYPPPSDATAQQKGQP